MALTSEAMSTVTFYVTVPGNTPAGAVPRLLGDTYRLGWVVQASTSVVDTTRFIDMTPVAGNLWTYTVQLGNGTCVNYLYTLGYPDMNNERDNKGNAVTRSLCANGITTVNDTVAAWKSPQQVPISLTATSPTGAEDTLYVQFGGHYPTKMWPTGPGTASYTLYANPSITWNYNYIRNGSAAIGVEIVGTDTNPPAQRTIATGANGAVSNDTIVWRDQMRETALSTVTTGISPPIPVRPGFQTGVELIDYWVTAWLPLVAPTLARIKSDNAQWVQIASDWSPVDLVNPTLEPTGGSFPTEDLVTHIRAAKAAGLNVAVYVQAYPNLFPGPHSTAWYDQFFNQIQLMALYHAKIAQQEGVGLLILPDPQFGVDETGGPATTYINAKWKSVIAAIRASGFTGKLTSSSINTNLPEETDWYGDLDYIGTCWFWPVAATDSASVQSMYDSAINILTSYYLPLESRFNKPFVFTEVEYYSADTSAMQVYNVDSPQISEFLPLDPSVASAYNQQAQAYQAVLLAFAATPWVEGCYSFGYAYFNIDSKDYSIRDKTAENIMSQIYRQIGAGQPVAPVSASPASGSGSNAAFTFSFSDSNGYQALSVVDVLIDNVLDGRHACYIAFVPSGANSGSVYLVDDAGDAGGPYQGLVLPGSGSISNTQCAINGTGSSVSGSGNTITLTLAITFEPGFSGNKIFYLSARDVSLNNSGWQALGAWEVPGAAVSGPSVIGMSPGNNSNLTQTYTFTFSDTNGVQDIAVANILVNGAINGAQACYLAFVPSSGSLFLVDDAGDAAGPYTGTVIPGSGAVSNSQCTVGGAGSTFTASGNILTLKLPITFTQAFAGNQIFFLAARNNTANSGWQAVGTVAVP